jgi:hypothetical protein
MKKAIMAALAVVLLLSGLLVGCGGVVKGSGNLDTQTFDFTGFTRVDVGNDFEVKVVQSDSYSITIIADDNLFEYIQVSKEGGTLKIGLKPFTNSWSSTLRAEITMPQLRGLDLSGATRGTVSGFSSVENLDIDVSGASSLDMIGMSAGDVTFDISGASEVTGDIAAGDANFKVSGASIVQLQGSANDIVIDASGASRAELAALSVGNADVELSGASDGVVNINGKLDVDLSGASELSFIGEPAMGTIDISGASTISRKQQLSAS